MSEFYDLMSDATDFNLETFGRDGNDRRLFLIIGGKEIPVVQNSLPRDASDTPAGYAVFGEGEIMVRKCDVYEATGGANPTYASIVSLRVEGQDEVQQFQIDNVDTSHADAAMTITLKTDDS